MIFGGISNIVTYNTQLIPMYHRTIQTNTFMCYNATGNGMRGEQVGTERENGKKIFIADTCANRFDYIVKVILPIQSFSKVKKF